MIDLKSEFIKENGLEDKYTSWLETKLQKTLPHKTLPAVTESMDNMFTDQDENPSIGNIYYLNNSYETEIDYDADHLAYKTQVCFPRLLSKDEKEVVENIIDYWSAIPFVSAEGNYGIEWTRKARQSFATIDIDFTKSTSDDYGAREILEKLAEWIWHGTPVKRDNTRTIEGVEKPVSVRAGSV
jgi:hypothetical protein